MTDSEDKSADAAKVLTIDHDNFDLRQVFESIRERELQAGINHYTGNILFEDFAVQGKHATIGVAPDIGRVLFPFLPHKKIELPESAAGAEASAAKIHNVIQGFTGYADPGSMTLVLGRPGSGCSTFLKAIAGNLGAYKGHKGELSYGGIPSAQMNSHFPGQLVYVPELDHHFPYLTVEQTLQFAVGCSTPNVRIDGMSRKEYRSTMSDLYMTLLGLYDVRHTLVGDDYVRGVSGGERKRVSIAEGMSTGGTTFCYDNVTRGLDAHTAIKFIRDLRQITGICQSISLVTAYQASDALYEQFDNVTVIYDGRQIYFGPAKKAVDYFVRMGYSRPLRQTASDFLAAVTDPLERVARHGYEDKVPKSAVEFESFWHQSPEYAQLLQDISSRRISVDGQESALKLKESMALVHQKLSGPGSFYSVSYFEQLRLCLIRATQMIINNKTYPVVLMAIAIFQALIFGSMLYDLPKTTLGAFGRGGTVFIALLFFSLITLSEVHEVFTDKYIIRKQKNYFMYRPSAQVVASQISKIPTRIIGIVAFSLIAYFLTGLRTSAGPFFIFILFVFLGVLCVSNMFNFFSSLVPNETSAIAVNGSLVMFLILYSSYVVQRPSMYWWFKWFSYINPVLYAFESIMATEFHHRMMPCAPTALIPRGSTYASYSSANRVCGFVGAELTKKMYPDSNNAVLGDIYLRLAFEYSFSHCWRNFGILIGLILGFLFLTCLAEDLIDFNPAEVDQLLFAPREGSPKSKNQSSVDLESNVDRSSSSAGMKLGSEDIFCWKNVNYHIPYKGEDLHLLKDVQGWVLPGTLTALMGASGAGKTTLLNTLSRRTDVGVVTGDFLVNGAERDKSFERHTGYVQQQDLHIAELTVRESLYFAARLRRPMTVPESEKLSYCDEIMHMLNMEDYADAVAGNVGSGLNVEQRKKLSIAIELVAKPSTLLFLDEPTSGLDAQSAWAIVSVLKRLAAAGQAILCTIHQPSATLFEQFDRLLLLKKGGETVYFGDIGQHSQTVLDYFARNGARPCGREENSAEYILENATDTVTHDWYAVWQASNECKAVDERVKQLASLRDEKATSNGATITRFATPYWYQFRFVYRRTRQQFYRDTEYIIGRLSLQLLCGLIIGFTFWDIKYSVVGMQNAMFSIFMVLVMLAPIMNQTMEQAMQSRELFEVRESKSSMFHWSCLLLSQALTEVPYSIVTATAFFVCFYFPTKMSTAASVCGYFWMTYCVFMQSFSISLGLMIVYASPNISSAHAISGALFNVIATFCGIVQPPSMMPGFWHFMWRLSPLTYLAESMITNVLYKRKVVCATNEMNYLSPPSGMTCGSYLDVFFDQNTGYVVDKASTTSCGLCPYSVGDDYTNTLSMSHSHKWRNVGLYFAYILFNLVMMLVFYWIRVGGLKSLLKKHSRKH